MPPKIRVMKYTLVIIGKKDQELLERGLPYEKFLLGPKNSSAPLELSQYEPKLNPLSHIARLELVHIHAARDHLVLTNPSILEITLEESEALYESVKDILAEISPTLYRPHHLPGKWFIGAEKLASLSTVHSAQAEGRNIDVWMPIDNETVGLARQWRKWQNEIQMIWFDHPVNRARQASGLLSINSVWISGIGCLSDIQPHVAIKDAQQLHSQDSYLSFLANHLQKTHLAHLETPSFTNTLSLLAEEDARTHQIWESAIQALRAQEINCLELIDFPEGVERIRTITLENLPKNGWAFWKKAHTPRLEDILGQS